MKVIDQAVPHFDADVPPEASPSKPKPAAAQRRKSDVFSQAPMYADDDDPTLTDNEADSKTAVSKKEDDNDKFYEAPDLPDSVSSRR